MRARLRARHATTSRDFEVLLVQENAPDDWWAMMRPGRRAPVGTRLSFANRKGEPSPLKATVTEINSEGHRRLRFAGTSNVVNELQAIGEVPLPPYIQRSAEQELTADNERYQTVYAREPGSVAAPTAGLHFTPELLDRTSNTGVAVCNVTLHVGLGTFAPVKAENLSAHIMHEERFSVAEETAKTVNDCKQAGGRVFAVGTTSLRVLETIAARTGGLIEPGSATTRLFIYPPYEFKCVNALLTNFHLPRSTLLMLVSAFASPGKTDGRELVLRAYSEAIKHRYRFFSYGDAMLLL